MSAEILEHPSDGLIRWSVSRLSRELGMARETIASRIAANGVRADGRVRGNDTYLMRDVMPAIFAGQDKAVNPLSEDFDPAQLPPKERKDYYDSEKRRLEVDQAKSLLIPADEFRRELAAVCKAVAQFMETLPDILERDCGLDPHTIDRIQRAADDQREQLADMVESLE